MNYKDKLTKEQILAALARLDELLREKGIIGEICIFGGAAMVLAFDARESTRDVDAIFVPKDDVLKSAKQVADEFDIRICDIVAKYYKESLLHPKVRFFIEEIVSEL